jgi:hypothetical protein
MNTTAVWIRAALVPTETYNARRLNFRLRSACQTLNIYNALMLGVFMKQQQVMMITPTCCTLAVRVVCLLTQVLA